jgi:HemK-like putative methylase
MSIQSLQVIPSNTAGSLSLVVIRNLPGDAFLISRQFRKQTALAGHPILGNAQDALSFRGESLCMSVTQLDFELDGIAQRISIEPAPRLQTVLDREARFFCSTTTSREISWKNGEKEKEQENTVLPLPLAYQTGTANFDGLMFKVTPAVMIPRTGSEALVQRAIELYHQTQTQISSSPTTTTKVLDLGTGSGCLLLSLLHRLPLQATGVGIDQSPEALQIAAQNAVALGLDDRCSFQQGSFAQLPDCLLVDKSTVFFDICLCNPPYHTPGGRKPLDAATLQYEPSQALLVEKENPLRHYRTVLQGLPRIVQKGTILVLEVFKDNAQGVLVLLQEYGLKQTRIGKDARECIRTVEGIY